MVVLSRNQALLQKDGMGCSYKLHFLTQICWYKTIEDLWGFMGLNEAYFREAAPCHSSNVQFLASQALSHSVATSAPYGQAAAATSCHVPPHVLRESLHQNEST